MKPNTKPLAASVMPTGTPAISSAKKPISRPIASHSCGVIAQRSGVSRRAAAALCASACSANSAKPSGISAFSTQRWVRPPGSDEISLIAYACCT